MNTNSRRTFFKTMLGFTGAALLAPQLISSLAQAEEGRRAKKDAGGAPAAGGDLPLVEPGKGMAASVNYHEKASDVKNAALKVARNNVPFEQQKCSNCMLYKATGKNKGEDVGTCTIFQGQLVKAEGWCATWQKKV